MADQNPPSACIFAEILCEPEERARQTRFYSQKAVGGHGLVGFPQSQRQHVHEVSVDIWILFCAFLKIPLADEAQLAIFNGDDRRRARLPINDGELACDFPGPENGQNPLFAPSRSYDDFAKASFGPVATVAGIPGGKKRFGPANS